SLVGIVATTLFLFSLSATADTRVDQVWTCTLNEGHTFEELNAVHGKWLAWANKQSYGGDIRGAVAQSMVASEFVVVIIDSYPDMATLAADWQAYESTKEGQALEVEYDEVSTCTSNALYSVTASGGG
ncbi:MAG: hypothetical protein ACR2RD_16630, partial [Woeseiaceae bacterium]